MEKSFIIWLTGLPGAGKTTLATLLAEKLKGNGLSSIEVLDGEEIRHLLSPNMGFSKEDREIHIRRLIYISKLLYRNGVIVIVAAISPYREVRDEGRKEIKDFVEVYVKCPVKVLIKRDKKGIYKNALRGEIANFTGISNPYEEPLNPEVIVETDKETEQISIQKILAKLKHLYYLPKHYARDRC